MKITFCLAIALATITVQAQQTSFEEAEGYASGQSIDGVNGWQEIPGSANLFQVSHENASEGENGLKMVYNPNHPLIFADWNFPEPLPTQDNLEISMDIYALGGMSTFYWKIKANDQFAAYIIVQEGYVFPAIVNVVNPVPLAMAPLNVGQFNEIRVGFDYTAETISYFANGEEIYQGTLWGSTEAIDQYSFEVFLFDNMFMDNLKTNAALAISPSSAPPFTYYIQNENLNLRSSDPMEHLEIYSLLGKLIYSGATAYLQESVSIASLSSGLYVARVKTKGQWHSFKFVR